MTGPQRTPAGRDEDRTKGKTKAETEMEELGKTSRTTDEIREQVEKDRDHGEPATTQQIPVTPAPISQEELERIEDEKRQKNREVQYPAAEGSDDNGQASQQ